MLPRCSIAVIRFCTQPIMIMMIFFRWVSDGSSCIFLLVSLILISSSHHCVHPKWECSQCGGYGTLQPLNIQGTAGVNKCIYFIFLLAINFAFAYLLRNWLKEKQACKLLLLFRLNWEPSSAYMLIKSASNTRMTIITSGAKTHCKQK